jgi:hypothetical protein
MKLTIQCTEDEGNAIAVFIRDNNLKATIVIDDRYLSTNDILDK